MVPTDGRTFGDMMRLSIRTEPICATLRAMTDATPLTAALERAGFRLTEPRRAVAQLIADQPGHFTSADLVREARVRRLGIGRATIFRTIEVLTEVGAIERIDLPNGEHAYVGCELTHHHHVVCSRCGRTAEIADAGLRTVVREVSRRTGFRVDEHRLELFGLCPVCQAAEPTPIRRTA
jgi:Fur family transcriptional regulator, ferric uptake regulator